MKESEKNETGICSEFQKCVKVLYLMLDEEASKEEEASIHHPSHSTVVHCKIKMAQKKLPPFVFLQVLYIKLIMIYQPIMFTWYKTQSISYIYRIL